VKNARTHALAKQRPHRAAVLYPSFAVANGAAKPATKAGFPATSEVYWSSRKKVDFYSFDADYLRRLQARDPATETHFVSYFGKRLQIKLRSRGFASAVLEDLSQETFFRVLTAVRNNTVMFPERFGAYVNAVCDKVILEKYREHARNQHLDVDAMDIPDGKTNLEAMVLRKEKRKIVADILAELPAKKRNILRALLFEQLDRDQLCARFKVKGDYLRVLLFRAREDFAALCKARGLDRLEEGLN
jgi:RNA polymerase sigma-70 factor, ECF subfamily